MSIYNSKDERDWAVIAPNSDYNFPEETELKKIDNKLYFAGGENKYFKT